MKRLSIAAIALMAAAAAGPAAAQNRTVRMSLDWAVEGQQSPFVLAADSGYFGRNGVEVRVDRGFGSGDTVTKVASGAYDVGFADLGAAIAFNGRQGGTNKIISIFQVYDFAPMSVMSLAKSNIRTPADLKGKLLASPPGDSSRVMFPVFAKANNLDMAQLRWLDVTPQLRETMLAQGQADAITAQITSLLSFRRLNVAEKDVVLIKYPDFGVDLYGHAIITTPEFATQNGEALKRMLKGVAAAWRDAVAKPEVSIAAMKKRDMLVDEALEKDRLQLIIDNGVLTPHVKANGMSAVVPARLTKTVQSVTESFQVPMVDVASLYRSDFLPPKDELMLPSR